MAGILVNDYTTTITTNEVVKLLSSIFSISHSLPNM